MTPTGEKVNIAETLFYTGEMEDGIVNNYYIGSFSATSPGIYTISTERNDTNAEGMITFTTGPADYYLLRANPSVDEGVEGEYDTLQYEATMTFTVQNGAEVKMNELSTLLGVNDEKSKSEAANDR